MKEVCCLLDTVCGLLLLRVSFICCYLAVGLRVGPMIVVLARYSTALTCVCVVVSPHLLQTVSVLTSLFRFHLTDVTGRRTSRVATGGD